jgi:7-cyano-7-deazaguanine reductase
VNDTHDKGPLLGRQVAGSAVYDAELLFPVPRENARRELPGGDFPGFGEDLWQCYELSWLDAQGCPGIYMGLIGVPASSPNIIESKSLKLYLNSLNGHRFDDNEAALACITADLSAVAGAAVSIELLAIDDRAFDGGLPAGHSLDTLDVLPAAAPDASLIVASGAESSLVYSHRLRSLCPVTAQPDWATVVIETRGAAADGAGLMAYLLSFREHREFHEQCVERIYCDIHRRLSPEYLSVHALYTRRGGLAICPWRCTDPLAAPRYRLNRQ